MPSTFALSPLAVTKASLVPVAVAVLVACALEDGRGTGPTPPTVVQIVTSPDTVTLDPYQQRQFFAFGRTDAGDSVAVSARWNATGGTITAGGRFTADTIAGAFQVTATASGVPVAGTSTVRARGPLAQVIVTPGAASTPVHGTVQFAAFGRRRNGDSVAVSVLWSVTGGGAVSTAGRYTAGPDAGTSQVIATQVGGTLADAAVVTVTAASGGGGVLFQETFEDNAFGARSWYDNTSMATTTAQHLPGSTRALEVHFTTGATTPTWGGSARRLFPASSTLYISYWVKYSANWIGSGHPYHPHEFLVMSDQDGDWDGPSNNWLTLYVEQNYQNGGIPRLQLQDNKAINTSYGALPVNLVGVTENRSTGGCNGVSEANVRTTCFNMPPWYNDKELSASQVWFKPSAGPGYKGDWNHVEVYFQLNSVSAGIGLPDGVMQYWFNGTLVIDRHDIVFRTGARPTIRFRQFLIGPYIGDGSPVDQYMWVDDLTVATKKP